MVLRLFYHTRFFYYLISIVHFIASSDLKTSGPKIKKTDETYSNNIQSPKLRKHIQTKNVSMDVSYNLQKVSLLEKKIKHLFGDVF